MQRTNYTEKHNQLFSRQPLFYISKLIRQKYAPIILHNLYCEELDLCWAPFLHLFRKEPMCQVLSRACRSYQKGKKKLFPSLQTKRRRLWCYFCPVIYRLFSSCLKKEMHRRDSLSWSLKPILQPIFTQHIWHFDILSVKENTCSILYLSFFNWYLRTTKIHKDFKYKCKETCHMCTCT